MKDSNPHAERLKSVRDAIAKSGLDGFLLPRTDEYQNEYLPPSAQRMEWLTGFTGSWGFVAILKDKAAAFVDGRYTVQAKREIDEQLFEIVFAFKTPIETWLADNVPQGAKLGYDPWLHTKESLRKITEALEPKQATLVALDHNPIDKLWSNRPSPPLSFVKLHDEKYAGESSASKLKRIREELKKAGATHLALTQPDNLAWTFNIRGLDIEHIPVALGFALIGPQGPAQIFMDPRKVKDDVRARLEKEANFSDVTAFVPALETLSKTAKLLVDPQSTSDAVREAAESAGAAIISKPDPVTLLKAQKNKTELDGARAAHRRDGAAIVRFLTWLDKQDKTRLGELDVATALERFRQQTGALRDISFNAVVGSGPNGAVLHYRVTAESSRTLDNNSLLVLDSGGQYLDGTTDITRTLPIGTPSAEMRRNFTLVLKGMITLTLARFAKGTSGHQLDALARYALWQHGLDYDHGTGHGVGSYLSVHEGPCRFSKIPTPPLLPGMILSNEPGYYEEGQYGIRIENLMIVTEASVPEGGNRPMHGFETLTLAPIERALIERDLLSASERQWLNDYHAHVLKEIGPLVDAHERAWLEQATQAI